MQPLAGFSREARAGIKGVFCDIDDTLTTDGRLTGNAYAALERLQRGGLLVVPVDEKGDFLASGSGVLWMTFFTSRTVDVDICRHCAPSTVTRLRSPEHLAVEPR